MSRKVPSAPESIRASVTNSMSAFFLSSNIKKGTVKDRLFAWARSTGEIIVGIGAGTDTDAGRFFKNPRFPFQKRALLVLL